VLCCTGPQGGVASAGKNCMIPWHSPQRYCSQELDMHRRAAGPAGVSGLLRCERVCHILRGVTLSSGRPTVVTVAPWHCPIRPTVTSRALAAPLHSSVRKVPVLVKPQCMLLLNLGYPSKPQCRCPWGSRTSVHTDGWYTPAQMHASVCASYTTQHRMMLMTGLGSAAVAPWLR
jgi:hypothetical protein